VTDPHPDGSGNLARRAAFVALGAEHHALAAEELATTGLERRGTVRRMLQCHRDAARILAEAVDVVAQVYGLRALGIHGQTAKKADGAEYALLSLRNPDALLLDATEFVEAAVQQLTEAYATTKKYPGLTVARRPDELRTVLASTASAVRSLTAEATARGLDADDTDAVLTALHELESRTCRTASAQFAGPTAEDVTAAILSNPVIARAAAAALARATP
jgi:hypothetical protein